MPVLSIRDLHVHYKGHHAVRGVSLDLEMGEKLVIMGPSGSGKSTLLKSIPRLVEPSSGTIIVDGVDVTKASPQELRKVRARIGYVPQNYGLFPHMTVLDNAILPLRLVHKIPREEAERRAMEALRALGIAELAHRYPAQLSGGQQQRAAIARALAIDPLLLLLDEPTSALDPESRASVVEALYTLAKLGKSMIVVTHEADFALSVADTLAYMEEGRIHAHGPPRDLIDGDPRVKKFLATVHEHC